MDVAKKKPDPLHSASGFFPVLLDVCVLSRASWKVKDWQGAVVPSWSARACAHVNGSHLQKKDEQADQAIEEEIFFFFCGIRPAPELLAPVVPGPSSP